MATKDLKRALFATLFFGAASGIFTATLNNYLAEVHHLGAEARGWLELPRELPGFLIMFVAGAMLTVFRETQMAAAAMLLTAIGAIGLGYLAPAHAALVVFIIIWSLGDHIHALFNIVFFDHLDRGFIGSTKKVHHVHFVKIGQAF